MAHGRATNESGEVKQEAGRDTSAIEYSADVLLSLNYTNQEGKVLETKELKDMREKLSDLLSNGRKDEAARLASGRKLTVTKNRFGQERSSCNLFFFGEHSKFIEKAPKGMEESPTWKKVKLTM